MSNILDHIKYIQPASFREVNKNIGQDMGSFKTNLHRHLTFFPENFRSSLPCLPTPKLQVKNLPSTGQLMSMQIIPTTEKHISNKHVRERINSSGMSLWHHKRHLGGVNPKICMQAPYISKQCFWWPTEFKNVTSISFSPYLVPRKTL